MEKIGRKIFTILGVRIDSTSTSSVLRFCQSRLNDFGTSTRFKSFVITTPNPEQIMLAQKDIEFKRILNSSDIAVCDAIGVSQAAKYLRFTAPKNNLLRFPVIFFQGLLVGFMTVLNKEWVESELEVIKGRDLFIELVKVANKKGWKVALLGDIDSARKAEEILLRSYKKVKLLSLTGPVLANDGVPITKDNKVKERRVVARINNFKPHLLFVGFGSPKQEKWMYRWQDRLKVGGTMVIGGTFDYISGKRRAVPKIFAKFGIEWLWRFITGDQKLSRILTAFPVFPLKVFASKLESL